MKFDGIGTIISNIINDRYVFDDKKGFKEELLSLSDENLKHKEILRIKRLRTKVDRWKTIVFVEIEAESEKEIKVELKKTFRWIASIKENLLGAESTDLYLFLAFNCDITTEECLRIESTEQFCRKYVLLPNEKISDFINRTFLQKLVSIKDDVESKDPLERAFSNTLVQHSWLTPEIQRRWKKAFTELSGSELFDALIEGRD